MKYIKITIQLIIFLLVFHSVYAQDSLLTSLATKNMKVLTFDGKNFKGEGWGFIKQRVVESQNVLIGEDHFSNEIPAFTKSLASSIKFDNFIIEVDPYSTEIIEKSIRGLSKEQLKQFNEKYKDLFSFYALKHEYELLEQIVNAGTNLLGSDQVVMYADRLVFQKLVNKTKSTKAKEIYLDIIEQSKKHLNKFFENPQNPMYFMTPEFGKQLANLELLNLSTEENVIITDVKKSVEIYQKRSHKKRIQLIMHQLIKDFEVWKNSKNLFKYGAMHMARGESFLTVYDIGNLVANITESNYKKSFHIMIIGESGMLGSPIRIFPSTPVNIKKEPLKSLKPFFDITQGKDWHLFDLLPLRKEVEKGKLKVDDINLLRTIKGFDVLIIIPEVTAAQF